MSQDHSCLVVVVVTYRIPAVLGVRIIILGRLKDCCCLTNMCVWIQLPIPMSALDVGTEYLQSRDSVVTLLAKAVHDPGQIPHSN